jgi:hypothetical protein
MRRHTIRVGDVAHIHPPLNLLVPVVAPVNGVAHEEKSVVQGKPYEEEEGGEHQPLLPIESFQGVNYFSALQLPSPASYQILLSRLVK